MARIIIVHLNVSVPDDDPRSGDEVADKILAALEVGLEGAPGSLASGDSLDIEQASVSLALVEEV